MHIDFNKMLIIQKTHAVLMLSIRHLIYVSIYVCCLKLILVKMIFFEENSKLIVYQIIT